MEQELSEQEQFAIVQEVLGGLYIQALRQYDLLCIIADKLGADAVGVSELHAQGKVLGPVPSLVLEDEKP